MIVEERTSPVEIILASLRRDSSPIRHTPPTKVSSSWGSDRPLGRVYRLRRQFDVRETGPWSHTETPKETPADSLVREAQAFYQTVNLKPW